MVGHGGDVYAAARQLRIPEDSIIDFSASINPLGTPASVMSVLRRHLKRLRHYPDPSATGLVQEIAKSTGLDPRMILCGNGSTELIYLVARAFRRNECSFRLRHSQNMNVHASQPLISPETTQITQELNISTSRQWINFA